MLSIRLFGGNLLSFMQKKVDKENRFAAIPLSLSIFTHPNGWMKFDSLRSGRASKVRSLHLAVQLFGHLR